MKSNIFVIVVIGSMVVNSVYADTPYSRWVSFCIKDYSIEKPEKTAAVFCNCIANAKGHKYLEVIESMWPLDSAIGPRKPTSIMVGEWTKDEPVAIGECNKKVF